MRREEEEEEETLEDKEHTKNGIQRKKSNYVNTIDSFKKWKNIVRDTGSE